MIKEVWSLDEGGGGWNPLFLRPFNDWELEEVNNLFMYLSRKRAQPSLEDEVVWVEEKNEHFSIKSMFKILESASSCYFPANIVWQPKIQPRICFFAWEATWGKASTLDRIQKRGTSLANRCFPCQIMEETIDHLLLHCGVTRVLWNILFSLFGVHWVFPRSVRQTLEGSRGSFVGKKRKEVWRAGPLCLFWTIWKARNKIAFEDAMLSIQKLKSSFVYFLWVETKLGIKEGPTTLVEFIVVGFKVILVFV